MPATAKLPVWARLAAIGLMFVATGLPMGCDDEESPALQRAEQRADQLAHQLENERRARARDHVLAETGETRACEDYQALAMILASGGIAIVILVLLLARERRARRVLERLLRLLLDRIAPHRGMPRHSPSCRQKETGHDE